MSIRLILAVLGIYLLILIYITNPFHHITIIRSPYTAVMTNDSIILKKNFDLSIKKGGIIHAFGFVKSGVHIIANVYTGNKKAWGEHADEIADEIYEERFNPALPFLISGDHFSMMYPRSLGVFYLSTLDPRIKSNETGWIDREKIYLQSTAYVIDAFSKNGNPCTTIVPVGPRSATCINIYAYPSDALYSVFFALDTLQSTDYLTRIYPYKSTINHTLHTTKASNRLIAEHKTELVLLLNDYKNTVYDQKTGLIKKNIHISGAKDIIRRESAFYDNVIYWKTLFLAKQLGIQDVSDEELINLKKRIIKTYWYDKGGYFLEDLSDDSKMFKYYSSDWLVVLYTGFLDPYNKEEQTYFVKSVSYIRREKLAEPFGLKYQQDNRASRAFWPVRFFLRSYGGTAIWSFWGTEYTKLLIILYDATKNKDYLDLAQFQLKTYEKNIEKYKGFPEVYDNKGNMLSNFFYKSVRQTGWIINYQQAKQMYEMVRPLGIEPRTPTL